MRLVGTEPGLRPRRPRGISRASIFAVAAGEALAGHRAERRRQILAAAHDRRPAARRPAGGSRWRAATAERTIAEQAHYLGHQDALKPSLTVAENLGSGRAISASAGRRAPRGARGGRARRRWPTCRRPISRPGSGGGCRSPGWSRCRARSGCSTSRPRRSTARRRTRSPSLMREHLAGGGHDRRGDAWAARARRRKRTATRRAPHERRSPPCSCATCGSRSASAAARGSACCSS